MSKNLKFGLSAFKVLVKYFKSLSKKLSYQSRDLQQQFDKNL